MRLILERLDYEQVFEIEKQKVVRILECAQPAAADRQERGPNAEKVVLFERRVRPSIHDRPTDAGRRTGHDWEFIFRQFKAIKEHQP